MTRQQMRALLRGYRHVDTVGALLEKLFGCEFSDLDNTHYASAFNSEVGGLSHADYISGNIVVEKKTLSWPDKKWRRGDEGRWRYYEALGGTSQRVTARFTSKICSEIKYAAGQINETARTLGISCPERVVVFRLPDGFRWNELPFSTFVQSSVKEGENGLYSRYTPSQFVVLVDMCIFVQFRKVGKKSSYVVHSILPNVASPAWKKWLPVIRNNCCDFCHISPRNCSAENIKLLYFDNGISKFRTIGGW